MIERVKTIIAQQLGIDINKITEESLIVEQLGADSLDIVEMIMAFSDEFGIEIPDEEAKKISTVEDIVEYLEQNQ